MIALLWCYNVLVSSALGMQQYATQNSLIVPKFMSVWTLYLISLNHEIVPLGYSLLCQQLF